jgi:lipopolysaccharide transport system permease protein
MSAPESLASPAPPTAVKPTRVIQPIRGWSHINLGVLWRYKDLIWFLTWRDIQLRYRQTVLGILWALIQPVATMTVFTIFFGRFGKMPSEGVPYPLFALAGLLPWQLFAYALAESSTSLLANQSLITKIYFPRLVIPLSSVLSGLVDAAIAFVLLLAMMAWFGLFPTRAVVVLPLLMLLAVAAALAVGLWLSALNVQYRDFRYTTPFLTQFWFFCTPIAYPSSLVPEKWRLVMGLNPMAGVVEGFRWALFGVGRLPPMLGVSAAVTALMLYGGMVYFSRMERTFADVV